MSELISIIIPVYNTDKYLERCLYTVLHQTYTNIEVILIDDGSTDRSGIICDQWKDKDERIITIHKKNGGLSDARNYGLRIAKGNYVSFVDSDDFVDRRFIEILYGLITSTGCSIAAVGYQKVDQGDVIQNHSYHATETEIIYRDEAIRCLLKNQKIYDYAWNKLYNRRLFETIHYPAGRVMEDLGTTYRLFGEAERIAYNPCKLYYYSQRPDSILHVSGEKLYEDKYALSKDRYAALAFDENLYQDNAYFFFRSIIDCYPHLDSQTRREAKQRLKELWEACKMICSVKNRIKFYLLSYNEKLFIRISNAQKLHGGRICRNS